MLQSGRDIGMGSLSITLITVSLMFLLSTAPIAILHMYEVILGFRYCKTGYFCVQETTSTSRKYYFTEPSLPKKAIVEDL